MSDATTTTLSKQPSWGKRLLNLAGIAKRPKPQVGMTPSDVVHAENKWRLIRYRPRAGGPAYKRPVLLVPSLINRHYVLDLMPGKSFAEWMVQRGHDVYVIDWGTPGSEDRYLSFDEITDRYLGRAVRRASEKSGGQDVHMLGYCLGGTLSTIYAAAHPERVASLVDIAAPIAFNDDGLLSQWTRRKEFDLSALLDAFGNVPWPLMQATFHMLRPTLNLSKGIYMLDRAWDDEFLDGFLALETWGNDNVSFPGEAFRKYITELYQRDSLVKGEFSMFGERVDLKNIECPLLAVTFLHDNIVPCASASVLTDLVSSKDKELLSLPGGHVGAVVSKHAAKGLWPKLSQFWADRDVRTVATTPSGGEPSRKRTETVSTMNVQNAPIVAAPEPASAPSAPSAPPAPPRAKRAPSRRRRAARRSPARD